MILGYCSCNHKHLNRYSACFLWGGLYVNNLHYYTDETSFLSGQVKNAQIFLQFHTKERLIMSILILQTLLLSDHLLSDLCS